MASLRMTHLIIWHSAHPACSLGPCARFPHLPSGTNNPSLVGPWCGHAGIHVKSLEKAGWPDQHSWLLCARKAVHPTTTLLHPNWQGLRSWFQFHPLLERPASQWPHHRRPRPCGAPTGLDSTGLSPPAAPAILGGRYNWGPLESRLAGHLLRQWLGLWAPAHTPFHPPGRCF